MGVTSVRFAHRRGPLVMACGNARCYSLGRGAGLLDVEVVAGYHAACLLET